MNFRFDYSFLILPEVDVEYCIAQLSVQERENLFSFSLSNECHLVKFDHSIDCPAVSCMGLLVVPLLFPNVRRLYLC